MSTSSIEKTVEAVARARSWDSRIALIRKVPEEFGLSRHRDLYAAIARKVYVPNLAPDFAYVHWRKDYELADLERAYDQAVALTKRFRKVDSEALTHAIAAKPETLRIFRLLLGFTPQEFAAATGVVAGEVRFQAVSSSKVKQLEAGVACSETLARSCAEVVDRGMRGTLFPAPTGAVKSKSAKPDTSEGWKTVRKFAGEGVPLVVFLHQRHYGGAFRQLLDATSTKRGDILEDAVEARFRKKGVRFLRTGSGNQAEIARRFGITVKPAPDFVVFDNRDTLRAILECKGANDGGTARDKAARFRSLRTEATRLGGIPLFAVLAGLGWKRATDALGPVVRDTDGRVFTIPTLDEMSQVQPFPGLTGKSRE